MSSFTWFFVGIQKGSELEKLHITLISPDTYIRISRFLSASYQELFANPGLIGLTSV